MVRACDINPQFAANEVGDFINNAHIIQANNFKTGKKRNFFISCPFCFYHPVTIIGQQPGCIRAIGAVNVKPFTCGYKTKYIITRNGFATIGQIVHNPVAAFAKNDQFRIFFCKAEACDSGFMLQQWLYRFWRFNLVAKNSEILSVLSDQLSLMAI